MFNKSNTNKPFSLNLNPDTLPDVSLEHDSTTDEVHLKFFNVDDEVVLDLWGQLNDVGPILSGLSTIAQYRALLVGIDEAVAKNDLAGAVECFNALKSLQLTPEFSRVFENVDITTSDSRAGIASVRQPEEGSRACGSRAGDPPEQGSQRDVIGFDALTGEEAEALLALLDQKFNGK